jgi:hypothetical protein
MQRQAQFPQRIEGIRTPAWASEETLDRCKTERDAFLVSVLLSGLTYEEISARMGLRKQSVHKWAVAGVPDRRVRAFCNATGTLLLEQWLTDYRAKQEARGRLRERDRIAAIASYTRAAA